MADSILELSRLENRTATMRAAPLDLATAVSRSVETHRALFESLGLTLAEDLAEGAVVVGDTDRLAQAFGNLISNAAHYTPSGGSVTVRLLLRGADAIVTGTDTGIGIQDDERGHAFERFWRSGAARARSRGGFGVGLAIVKEIVDQHRGSVWLAPNPDGQGTVASVSLPLVDRKSRQAV